MADLHNLIEDALKTQLVGCSAQSFSVRKIIRNAVSRGYVRKEVKRILGESCSKPEIQQLWSQWSIIEDREELRLRMELIRHFSSIIPELHDFIKFFFRASDPVMYQAAAYTLGTKLENHPELMDYFTGYLKRWSVQSDKPVELNGDRSRRRILITIAAYQAERNPSQSEPTFAFPLQLETGSRAEELDSSDLNVTLIATGILLDSKTDFPGLTDYATLLITNILKKGIKSSERNLVRNWGFVISRLKGADKAWQIESYINLLQVLFNQYRSYNEEQFNSRIQVLHQIDEVLHSTVHLHTGQQRALYESISGHLDPWASRLSFIRLTQWHQRTFGQTDSPLLLKKITDSTHFESDLIRFASIKILEAEKHLTGRSDKAEANPHLDLFTRLLTSLENNLNWLKTSLSERSISLLFMIDLVMHELEGNFQVSRLLSIVEAGQESDNMKSDDYPDALRIHILAHQREAVRGPVPVDSNLIHQIPDADLLLIFLDESSGLEMLAVLADAFEHHLRLQLVRAPDFSVSLYLYKIAGKKPDPLLFDLLARTCRNRIYHTTDETPVPVYEMVNHFRVEMKLTSDEILKRFAPPVKSDEAGENGFKNDTFYQELTAIRHDLIGLHNLEDLFESLARFADIMDPGIIETDTGSRGVTDLVQKIAEYQPDLLDQKDLKPEQITYKLSLTRENSRWLLPESLGDLNIVKDARLKLKDLLQGFETLIIPKLSHVDANLFQLCILDLRTHMDQWVQATESIHAIYQKIDPGHRIGKANWEELFGHINPLPTHSMKSHLIRLLFHSLLARSAGTVNSGDSWTSRHNFLRSSALSSYKQLLDEKEYRVWEILISEEWAQLAGEAMESQYETRLQLLLEESVFHFVYKTPRVTSLMYEIRAWFYDRYNVGFTQKLGKLIDEKVFNIKRDLLSFRSYFLHFTHMWVALVIGAILMLDFGDAWTALAEIGDVEGIIITFLVGVVAAGIYLYIDLRSKSKNSPEDSRLERTISRWMRIGQFLTISLFYTLAITSLLWLLFSSTDEVVHGTGAILHIFGWTGFALLIGIFFGLLSRPT